MDTQKDIQVESLTQKVQSFRDKAREILRMKKINALLQEKFNVTRDKGYEVENLAKFEKDVARSNYRLSKLDKADPDYAEKLKEEERYNKTAVMSVEDCKLSNARKNAYHDKREAEIDEAIAKWESGENKVSIIEVEELAEKMIIKS